MAGPCELPDHVWALGLIYYARHEFPLVEWVLNPSRKQLVTPIIFVPLLQPREHFAVLVIIIVCVDYSSVRLLITPLPTFS